MLKINYTFDIILIKKKVAYTEIWVLCYLWWPIKLLLTAYWSSHLVSNWSERFLIDLNRFLMVIFLVIKTVSDTIRRSFKCPYKDMSIITLHSITGDIAAQICSCFCGFLQTYVLKSVFLSICVCIYLFAYTSITTFFVPCVMSQERRY